MGPLPTLIQLHSQIDGQISDPTLNADHLTNLGLCHSSVGDYQQAIKLHTQARDIYRETGM
jgi:hypothetical protein